MTFLFRFFVIKKMKKQEKEKYNIWLLTDFQIGLPVYLANGIAWQVLLK